MFMITCYCWLRHSTLNPRWRWIAPELDWTSDMAFFRNVIILGAVVAVLPTDQAQQSQFYDRATGALTWTMTFCDRNAAVCSEGRAMWDTFSKKAEFGAEVVYTLVQQQLVTAPVTPAAEPAAASRGTLKPDDMRPNWREPVRPVRPGI